MQRRAANSLKFAELRDISSNQTSPMCRQAGKQAVDSSAAGCMLSSKPVCKSKQNDLCVTLSSCQPFLPASCLHQLCLLMRL